jgi:hypothetical protein
MTTAGRIVAPLAGALLLVASGCSSSSEVKIVNRLVPKDQELSDLKRALDAGALSPTEYEQQRRKVLESR